MPGQQRLQLDGRQWPDLVWVLGRDVPHRSRRVGRDVAVLGGDLRVIPVPAATGRELRAWQLQSGGRGQAPIVGEMTANALRLWGAKRLRPAVAKATGGRIADASTYTLRHSLASACHYVSTLTVPEICRRLGHSQQTHFLHYPLIEAQARSDVPPMFRERV